LDGSTRKETEMEIQFIFIFGGLTMSLASLFALKANDKKIAEREEKYGLRLPFASRKKSGVEILLVIFLVLGMVAFFVGLFAM
jgi:hypothetical protein